MKVTHRSIFLAIDQNSCMTSVIKNWTDLFSSSRQVVREPSLYISILVEGQEQMDGETMLHTKQ